MRLRKKTDPTIGPDGTAACVACDQTVPIDATGRCELGHRVTSPDAAAASMHASDAPIDTGSAPADPTDAPADPGTAPADPGTAPADLTDAPADPGTEPPRLTPVAAEAGPAGHTPAGTPPAAAVAPTGPDEEGWPWDAALVPTAPPSPTGDVGGDEPADGPAAIGAPWRTQDDADGLRDLLDFDGVGGRRRP